MKKCPFCAEEIQEEAIVCRYCNRSLTDENPLVNKDDMLDDAIANYTSNGWVLVNRTNRMAQLKKRKEFSWLLFFFLLIVGLVLIALPAILYLIFYAVQKEPVVTLTLRQDGTIDISGDQTYIQSPSTSVNVENAKTAAKSFGQLYFIIIGLMIACVLIGVLSQCS